MSENARRDSLLASIDKTLGGIEKHLKTLADNSKPSVQDPLGNPPDPFAEDLKIATLPHSRACGSKPHQHGSACHENCPSCEGNDKKKEAFVVPGTRNPYFQRSASDVGCGPTD